MRRLWRAFGVRMQPHQTLWGRCTLSWSRCLFRVRVRWVGYLFNAINRSLRCRLVTICSHLDHQNFFQCVYALRIRTVICITPNEYYIKLLTQHIRVENKVKVMSSMSRELRLCVPRSLESTTSPEPRENMYYLSFCVHRNIDIYVSTCAEPS